MEDVKKQKGLRTCTTTGKYTRKRTGEEVQYQYSYPDYSILDKEGKFVEFDLQAMINDYGEQGLAKICQRMVKTDANNPAREDAKVANGDSTRAPLTEAQKAANKAKTAMIKSTFAKLQEKAEQAGLSVDEYLESIA